MSKFSNQLLLALLAALSAFITTIPAGAQNATAPDATLYTSYNISSNLQTVNWSVCGSTQQSEGCYASGSLGPFGTTGALIEGNPATRGDTITRTIYIVDIASGSNASGVTLYVYKKIDTVMPSFDTVTVTLTKTVDLPLVGGTGALCSMAANGHFLFIGTNKSSQAVRVQKSNYALTQLGGFSPPINVTAITANSRGYVTVSFGGFSGGENGNYIFGPNGQGEGDGGGASFMLNTVGAVLPSTLPKSDAQLAGRLSVNVK
ncbi:MAG TPA: hypothetical protein VFA74_00640 [Terriglobales bacterium]|nr:hypothetical protein [Terriglobales bacterium]